MSVKINCEVVRKFRLQHHWTQEELATASGLSLRTIQRLEKTGFASPQTLKAIAATLQVNVETLTKLPNRREVYLNVQLNIVSIVIAPLLVWHLIWLLNSGAVAGSVFLSAILLIACLTVFISILATEVTDSYVSLRFGLGFFKKTIALSTIASAKVVKNKAWWGWGIRLIPNGWLYNIYGLDAVELALHNGSVIRIGSDEAAKFNDAINAALGS